MSSPEPSVSIEPLPEGMMGGYGFASTTYDLYPSKTMVMEVFEEPERSS